MFSAAVRRPCFKLFIALAILAAAGCSFFQDEGEQLPNRPPEIYLTSGPPIEDTDASYRVYFHWHGYDPDGYIDHFQHLITDDEVTGSLLIDENINARLAALGYEWTDTEAFAGEFLVTADSIPDSGDEPADSIYFYGERFLFHAAHTFFIRAVDGQGAVSPLPAHRSFTAVNIAPEVEIVHPADMGGVGGYDTMSLDVLFRWTGDDSLDDGSVIDPDSTRFALLERGELGLDTQDFGLMLEFPDSIWSTWRHWEEEDSTGAAAGSFAWVNDLTPFSDYLFFVQAKDEAGAVTSHYEDGKNLRKLHVLATLQPMLLLSESVLGTVVGDHDITHNFTIAADQQLSLTWWGSAEHYGSEIDGYRYGWDLIDPDNDAEWSDWSLDHTGTVASFPDGDHEFYLECRDLSGNSTRFILFLHVVPFTMEYDLLLVDDYDNSSSGNPNYSWPGGEMYTWGTFFHDDAMMKDWWEAILEEYAGYVSARDFFRVSVICPTLPLETLASYRRVIWEVKEEAPGESGLARVAGFVDAYTVNTVPYDYLSVWMEEGGQLLLCGVNPVFAMLPLNSQMGIPGYERRTPLAFLHDLGYSDGPPSESEAAVQRFLPWKQFGLDAVVRPADQTPKEYDGITGDDFKTYRTCWGMVGAGYLGDELTAFPSTVGGLPDTLLFRPEVYEWFADAGAVFNSGPEDCCWGYWGLDAVEVYNWDWFAGIPDPPLGYRPDQYLPLVGYIPADSTTRWGVEPAAEHSCETPSGEPYCELCYATGGDARHVIAVVGMQHPETPSVLLGFPPFYLEQETAHSLIDHILIDIMAMEK